MILRYYLITSRVRLAVVCGPDRVVGDSSYYKVMQCETSCRRYIMQCEHSSDWMLPQIVVQCENNSDPMTLKIVQWELGISARLYLIASRHCSVQFIRSFCIFGRPLKEFFFFFFAIFGQIILAAEQSVHRCSSLTLRRQQCSQVQKRRKTVTRGEELLNKLCYYWFLCAQEAFS